MQKFLTFVIILFGLIGCAELEESRHSEGGHDSESALERSSSSYSKHDVLAQRIATLRNSRAQTRRR